MLSLKTEFRQFQELRQTEALWCRRINFFVYNDVGVSDQSLYGLMMRRGIAVM